MNFNLPDQKYYITEDRTHFTKPDYIMEYWDHPFIEASNDIKEQINNFNKAQPRKYYSAHTLTKSMINYWCVNKIYMIRELVKFIPILKKYYTFWLNKINVLNMYYINEPKRGRITDGIIITYYISEGDDKIITVQLFNKENVIYNENIIKDYYPESKGKIYSSSSSILFYLEDKMGTSY